MNNNKNFRALLSSLFISKVGDFAYEVVFVFIVLETTSDNYFITGVIYFFKFIPFLFFGPIGGWMADNYKIDKSLIISEWLRLIVSLFLFLSYLTESLNVIILITASVLTTIGRSVFQPVFQSAVPKIVSAEHLTKANSLLQVTEETASVTGPLICSLIITFFNKPWVLMFNSLTYFSSAIIILSLRNLNQEKHANFQIKRVYAESFSALRGLYLCKFDLFISIISSAICIVFTGSTLRFIIPAIIISHGKTEVFTSYIFSLMAAGTISGGLLYGRFVTHTVPDALMRFWTLYGLTMLAMFLTTFLFIDLILPFSFFLGFIGAFVDICLVTVIQEHSNENNIGKNFAIFSTLANTAEATSGLATGIIAAIGLITSFAAMSSMIVLTGLTSIWLLFKKAGR